MTCANGAAPLGLSWENVTVSNDGKAAARGIGIGIGSPQQIFALAPSTGNDDTWVFNAADCVSAGNSSCIGQKGGVFNASLSTTYVVTTEAAWNGTDQNSEFEDGNNYIFFNEKLSFGSSGVSDGFPLLMDQPGLGSQSGLGIGPNSTFLDMVVTTGQAPSRAFGLWVGSRSVNDPVDGAMWIGGYDTARVAAEFTVFPNFNDNLCVGCVVITNLTYVTSEAETSLFSNSSETLQVALEPFTHSLGVPQDIFANFLRASNGTVGTDPGTTALATLPVNAELGNLSVTFSNGYQTTIPGSELFLPPRQYGKDGTYGVTNDSYLVAALANLTTEGSYVLDWGIPILTMNYMIMDYDNQTFSLAPARQGPYGSSSGALIEPLCQGIAPVTTSAGAPQATNSTVPATPSASAAKTSHTNVGAIAGGVVGGIAGLVIICLLAFFIVRGKRREKRLRQERDSIITGSTTLHDPKDPRISQYAPTSPTEVSEADQSNINQWLHSQDKFIAEQPQQSASLAQPFEMPAVSHK